MNIGSQSMLYGQFRTIDLIHETDEQGGYSIDRTDKFEYKFAKQIADLNYSTVKAKELIKDLQGSIGEVKELLNQLNVATQA